MGCLALLCLRLMWLVCLLFSFLPFFLFFIYLIFAFIRISYSVYLFISFLFKFLPLRTLLFFLLFSNALFIYIFTYLCLFIYSFSLLLMNDVLLSFNSPSCLSPFPLPLLLSCSSFISSLFLFFSHSLIILLPSLAFFVFVSFPLSSYALLTSW